MLDYHSNVDWDRLVIDGHIRKESAVYLIRMEGTDFYKIGLCVAGEEERRRVELQTGNPHELVVVGSGHFRFWSHGLRCEQELHRRYGDKHVRGEWFLLDACEVGLVLRDAEDFKG
ncbi:MAG: GIY-YIG nuclease family protein [Gammaproteobacteria bacterium]|nr:GIY-YIG nuclease family protein [Gammaproteobacteria bacterium]